MNYKPILFNTEMVQAITEGRKTQTRRLVKQPPIVGDILHDEKGWYYEDGTRNGHALIPPCNPGDILWVRETWRPVEASSAGWCRIEYKAGGTEDFKKVIADLHYQEPWHPSIHMPKEAARIFLRVKDVRAERLQDITEDDVCAEGAEPLIVCDHEHPLIGPDGEYYDMCYNGAHACSNCPIDRSYGEMFGEKVWNPTIKNADLPVYGWDANPWVWVIEFESCEKPEGWCC